jgi:alpha/beta superfamily hydrolase
MPTADPIDILEEAVTIDAPSGALSGVLAYPLAGAASRAALVIGPHPLMGGRLENNVVRAVARGLAEHGLSTLRFAFAGDGPSAEVMDTFWRTGHAPNDPAHVEDARAAAGWFARSVRPPDVLVGYSFGAAIAGLLLDEIAPARVALISPTLTHHDLDGLARSSLPKLVMTSDNDFATPLATVEDWVADCAEPKTLVVLPSAEHFFRDQEDRLVQEIVQWLRD